MNRLAQDKEEELISLSKRGEVSAFNQLVLHYQQSVYNTVFRLLGDSDISSDITQDTFIAAYRSIDTFRGGSSFRAWILRIATNQVHDHWRRVRRHPADSLETLLNEDDAHGPALIDTLALPELEGNPEEYVLNQELQALISQGLQELALDQRTTLVLYDIQGLSYEEIAQVTGTTLGTVRSRLSRARTRLRQFLYQHRELLPRNYRLTKEG